MNATKEIVKLLQRKRVPTGVAMNACLKIAVGIAYSSGALQEMVDSIQRYLNELEEKANEHKAKLSGGRCVDGGGKADDSAVGGGCKQPGGEDSGASAAAVLGVG